MAFDGTIQTSGLKTADAVIKATKAYLHGVKVLTNKSADVTLILYDNASAASGTVLYKTQVVGNTYADLVESFPYPVQAVNGIYADVTGTDAEYIVYFS